MTSITIDYLKCPICDSNLTCLWSDRYWLMPNNQREFQYGNCLDCGTIFCTPRPAGHELAVFYRDYFNYDWFREHLPLKRIQAAHRWHRMASIFHKHSISKGSLLDIGCGHGLFLSHADKAKWTAVGVDYPSIATRYAQEKLGLIVLEGDLRTVLAAGRLNSKFDLVTAWHCLEHDTEPLTFFEGISSILSPNGKVLIAVPNAEAWGMKLMRENWIWCQQPYVHVNHFTEKSLSLLARRSKLNVLATWTRDTWDAHPAYDVHTAPYIMNSLKSVRRLNYHTAFWLEEVIRLSCYIASCQKHWLFRRERTDGLGSELLLLAEQDR